MIGKSKKRKGRRTMECGTADLFHSAAGPQSGLAVARAVTAPVSVDLERYRRHIVHLDLPEDKKTELLQAVWQMMQSFVDRAFGEDSAQLCRGHVEKCDTDNEPEAVPVIASPSSDIPQNHQDLSRTFRRMAKQPGRRKT